MIINKFIEGLEWYDKNAAFTTETQELAKLTREMVFLADKFDFGIITDEQIKDLTKEERLAIDGGYIPIPFPVCYFEHVTPWECGDITCGYLIADVTHKNPDHLFSIVELRAINGCVRVLPWSVLVCKSSVEGELSRILLVETEPGAIAACGSTVELEVGSTYNAVAVMLLMLTATTTHVQRHPAPKEINRRRAKKGKLPIFEYHTVKIVPAAARSEPTGEFSGRASPRLHWRRAHVRTLPDGRRIAVKRALVGSGNAGVIMKDYRLGR